MCNSFSPTAHADSRSQHLVSSLQQVPRLRQRLCAAVSERILWPSLLPSISLNISSRQPTHQTTDVEVSLAVWRLKPIFTWLPPTCVGRAHGGRQKQVHKAYLSKLDSTCGEQAHHPKPPDTCKNPSILDKKLPSPRLSVPVSLYVHVCLLRVLGVHAILGDLRVFCLCLGPLSWHHTTSALAW